MATVDEIMDTNPCVVRDHTTLGDVATILAFRKKSAVILSDVEGRLSGIFTETDLAKAFVNQLPLDLSMADLMTTLPQFVSPETTIDECSQLMTEIGFRHLPVVDQKKIVGMVEILGIQESISRRLQNHIEQLNEAHKEILRRDDFLAIAAHDVRAPLAVIKVCCNFLQTYDAENLNAEQRDLIERVDHNCEAAQALLDDLLDIGRLKAGLKLQYETVDIAEFIKDLVENQQYVAKQKNIHLKCVVSSTVTTAELDIHRYTEIVVNILTNAVKFSPKNSVVSISADVLEDQFLCIGVKDSGPGIKSEALESIFGKYTQHDAAKSHKGFGLGLNIAYQLVHLHGGRIEVESKEGHGALFRIITPLRSICPQDRKIL